MGPQRHGNHDVVADYRSQFDGSPRAEHFHHAFICRISNLAVTQQLGGEFENCNLAGSGKMRTQGVVLCEHAKQW